MSFDAIGIVSENPARSVEFFKILGVEIKQYENSGHYEGKTPSGVRIMLDTVDVIRTMNPNWQKATGNGIVMCFKQPSPQNVDEIYKRVVDAGFSGIKSPWDAFWGQRYACVSDPDGNQIDLFANL
jgi:uncharacterized glyoxalase superfamily protein PhnB